MTYHDETHLSFSWQRIVLRSYPVCIYSMEYLPGHVAASHFHDCAQIWFCTSGRYTHRLDGRDYHCERGSVCIVYPGLPHEFVVDNEAPAKLYCIDLRYDCFNNNNISGNMKTFVNSFLPAYESDIDFKPITYIELSENSSALADDFLFSAEQLNKNRSTENLDAHYLLIEQFFSLPEFNRFEDTELALNIFKTKMAPISRALSYINENFSSPITISKLMQVSALCQTNFTSYFKKFTTVSFAKYLQLLRIQHARTMLGVSDYSISYISDVCGFANHAHMVSCFKRLEKSIPKKARSVMKDYYDRNPMMKQKEKS